MASNSKIIRIKSIKNQTLIADKCYVAESFFQRLKGLLGKRLFETGEGLLISRCNNIHMWFMQIPIDVVFVARQLDEMGATEFKVTSVREELRPWRALPVFDSKASDTLELPVGTIQRCEVSVGDILCIN